MAGKLSIAWLYVILSQAHKKYLFRKIRPISRFLRISCSYLSKSWKKGLVWKKLAKNLLTCKNLA